MESDFPAAWDTDWQIGKSALHGRDCAGKAGWKFLTGLMGLTGLG
jgi:hypothetical protein